MLHRRDRHGPSPVGLLHVLLDLYSIRANPFRNVSLSFLIFPILNTLPTVSAILCLM
jgi:hypothetical protein